MSQFIKNKADLQIADANLMTSGVEADAGHPIPGLRESIDEAKRINMPSIEPLMDQVMVIASIWAMATNNSLAAVEQQKGFVA